MQLILPLTSHKNENANNAHLAKNIGLEDTAENFTATDVEGAMSELFTNVSDGKDLVGTAITDVDPNITVPTSPTFQQLATAIGSISTGKKWASGTVTSSAATMVFDDAYGGTFSKAGATVNGLTFLPRLVILTYKLSNTSYTIYYADGFNNSYPLLKILLKDYMTYEIRGSKLTRAANVTATGFTLPVDPINTVFNWEAYE